MTHALLLGAGFSRNWGGWLVPELVGELLGQIADDAETCALLRKNRNFEDTLSELKAQANTKGGAATERLQWFEHAILETFGQMNRAYAQLDDLNFSNDRDNSILEFLARFDVIFTLNQDLLLELYYDSELCQTDWVGSNYPGVPFPRNWSGLNANGRIEQTWNPDGEVRITDTTQPIIKLHGSINWRDPKGNQLIVMGRNKPAAIERHPVLSRYQEIFDQYLTEGDTRLMTIGYGFNDEHINRVLIDAGCNHGMRMYIVNPNGLDLVSDDSSQQIPIPNPLKDIPIIGVSTRPLRDTFSGDILQRDSLNRFFE